MTQGRFAAQAARPENPHWEALTSRQQPLYARPDDIRSPFARDATRILHCTAYRRLKHKTQVFYNIANDHICTRMEHVTHVESVSGSIARALGLNEELTQAISMGHDLGHAPFGHQGEKVLDALSQKHLQKPFWHEQNGLRFADKLELLPDDGNRARNLCLTYAVRDGILAHCGEVDQNGLRPRPLSVPLKALDAPGKFQAVTWEGCVVKLADKIAYLGRDIEDALTLGFIRPQDLDGLRDRTGGGSAVLNTTVLIHGLIQDVSAHSDPQEGIRLSPGAFERLKRIKAFNYENIYRHERFKPFERYCELVLNELFDALFGCYDGPDTWRALNARRSYAPGLTGDFERWLAAYCDPAFVPEGPLRQTAFSGENEKVYGTLSSQRDYAQALLDFLSGMSDRYAIARYEQLLAY